MANRRIYNEYIPYDRPKLPRSKYGNIVNTAVGTTTYYSNPGNNVGASMASLSNFRGSTRTEDGERGLVPAPLAGQNTFFLQGAGGWTRIPAFEWMSEFPASAGLEKSGLQVNGDLRVLNNLKTLNLEVEGAAHFWTLIIDEVKANGGNLVVSPSSFSVDYVGEVVSYDIFDVSENNPLIELISARTDIYNILKANNVKSIRCRRLYQRDDDGRRKIDSMAQSAPHIGDMLRCRQFNVKKGEYRNIGPKDYWSFVVNTDATGTSSYTDENGEVRSAYYIDLAFSLVKEDAHNIPLGSILFSDGSDPILPKGYKEITDAHELKKVSEEVWDGSREVDWPEYFEGSEWASIQESVIKIRGLDDALEAITGKSSSNNLYDNENYAQRASVMLNEALNGSSSEEGRANLNSTDMSTLILTGSLDPESNSTEEGNEEVIATKSARAINGQTIESVDGIKIKKSLKSTITLAEGTDIERPFTVIEDAVDPDDPETIVYPAGTQLSFGDVITVPVKVNETEESEDIVGYDVDNPNIETTLPEEEVDIIKNGTKYSTSGIDRDMNYIVEEDYSTRVSWAFGYVGDYNEFKFGEGDALACLGHLYDGDRDNAIVLSSTNPIDPELLAPAIAQYNHINTFGKSISNFRQTAIASNGNEFIGSFLVNYNNTYLDINERINLMIMDIKSGLENVGIHLDGDSSTITLVGSVDLKQHSNTSYDTLNLYDNLGVKRVEITPFDIDPKEESSQIDNTTRNFGSVYDWKTAKLPAGAKNDWKDWDGPFWYSWMHSYTLNNYIVNYSTSVNLGYLEEGTELDLRDFRLNLVINTWLCGYMYDAKRFQANSQTAKQYIIGDIVTWRLKCNGIDYEWDNLNVDASGLQGSNINIYASEINLPRVGGNDYVIKKDGTYTLEVSFSVNVYAYVETGNDYNNPYYNVESKLGGSIIEQLNRAGIGTNNGYKLTIGTNGFELVTNNSRHLHAANDGFELYWDENFISMDADRGMFIRRAVREVRPGDSTLDSKFTLINARNTTPHSSYTITLPKIDDHYEVIDGVSTLVKGFGRFREITILGWINTDGTKLTVACQGNDKIEININGYQELSDIDFLAYPGYPICSLTLISTGTDRWRVVSMI